MTEPLPTERLYRNDSYAKDFTANVIATSKIGDKLEVLLDRTIFYPTAGGQANDLGTLAGFKVLDVRGGKSETNVIHVLEANKPVEVQGQAIQAADVLEPGAHVRGRIDWARRFDLMQQHTGEHILGQAFYRLGAHVIAVNMESQVCTLDLEQSIDPSTALEAETNANQAIWQAHEIASYEVPEAQINNVPLRRTPKVSGLIRVVQIGTYDYSACGGTHLRNSSEVGMLKILKFERIKAGATRVHFLCGERCLNDYRFKHEFTSSLGLKFSTSTEQLPARTETMLEEFAQSKRDLATLRSVHAKLLASSLANASKGQAVVHVLDDAGLLIELAKAFALMPGTIALLGARSEDRAMLAVACGPGHPSMANEILKLGLGPIAGKGGGKADLAQGSGPEANQLEAALELMLVHANG